MSQTIAMDAVGPSRWAHMAAVMAEVLDSTIKRGTTQPAEIPIAVLGAAQLFFRLAADVLEGKAPENPQASVANYRIAANAIRASVSPPPMTPKDLEKRIRTYADFIAALQAERKVSQSELDVARELRGFFQELAAEGAAEQYEQFASSTGRGMT